MERNPIGVEWDYKYSSMCYRIGMVVGRFVCRLTMCGVKVFRSGGEEKRRSRQTEVEVDWNEMADGCEMNGIGDCYRIARC